LVDGDPFQGLGRAAVKPEGAMFVVCTGSAAEVTLIRVGNAAALEAGGRDAVVVGGTGATEPREIRNTDPGRIRSTEIDLLANKSAGALFYTGLGADGVTHVVHTNPT